MKSRIALLPALVVPLFLIMFASAAGAAPLSAIGSVSQTTFTVTDSHTAGNVTFLKFEETDSLTGTFTGTSVLAGECIVFATGEGLCKANETFTGTVAGTSGTVDFVDLIRIDNNTGAFEGSFVVVGGTGDLDDLHGHGTFEGTGTTGSYSGRIIFTG